MHDAVARSREVRRYCDSVWPALAPPRVLHRLLSSAEFLAECASGVLSDAAQAALLWAPPPRTAGAARWSAADAVLLDELADLLERTPSLGHVVLDEAQDLSPMQLRAVGRRCSTGSATVLGDIAQGTTPWSTPGWPVTLEHLGREDALLEELDRGFRVPAAVIDFAARLLPVIAPDLRPPTSVRDDPGSLVLDRVPELWPGVRAAAAAALAHEGTVGVIVRDADEPAARRALAGLTADRLAIVPATVAKGLEYDRVVVAEPADIADAEPDERTGLRRLYVVLTRAVSGLAVVHTRPLPGPLGGGARRAGPADVRSTGREA